MGNLDDYRQYLSLSSELYCSLDNFGNVSEPMGPWHEKTGHTQKQLIGESIYAFIYPDDVSVFKEILISLQKSDHPREIGLRFRNRFGDTSWFEVKIVRSIERNLFWLRAQDISERMKFSVDDGTQTNSLLQEIGSIKQRLELAIRAVKFGVWDWNLKTGKLIWDSYMYELYGIKESDFTSDYDAFGKTLLEEDRNRVNAQLEAAFTARTHHFNTEFRIRTKTGKIKIINAEASCFYDCEGKIERVVGNNWDITETRETEMKLREAHNEIEKFFSISSDPLCVANEDGLFKRVNSAFSEMTGFSVSELTSQPFINFIHPEDQTTTRQEFYSLDKGVSTVRFESRFKTRIGTYLYFNWAVTSDPESGVYYCAIRDMTEQIKTQYKALQSAQMATLGEMASGVAHEINNPLAIVQGKARQIDRAIQIDPIDVDKIRSDVQKIVSTTDRIVKIVKGLRSFSRDSTKDPLEKISIKSIIEEVLDLSGERFRNHEIDLRVNIESDVNLECRGSQIGQVLMNLVNNGHDAVIDLISRWVEVEVKHAGDWVRIYVTDSGTGIQPGVADKMMQPFYTTKGAGKGTGLGLSISKGIAEDHHGTLRYDSNAFHTRFVLELPVVQKKEHTSKGLEHDDISKEIALL